MRDPIDRSVSHYQFFKKDSENQEMFEEWIQKPLYRNVHCQKICGEQNADKAIEVISKYGFVGLQEQFDESLILLKRWIASGTFDIHYQAQNVAKSKTIANQILQESDALGLVKEANLEDIKLYEFVKKELFPSQITAYGSSFNEDLALLRKENQSFRFQEPLGSRVCRKLYKILLPLLSRGSRIQMDRI